MFSFDVISDAVQSSLIDIACVISTFFFFLFQTIFDC